MAGSLVLVNTVVADGTTAEVTITGIDSTYDVYLLQFENYGYVSDQIPVFRVTEGGTTRTDSEFDRAAKTLFSVTSFGNESGVNETQTNLATIDTEADAGKGLNGNIFIFNANNSSEYTFFTIETVGIRSANQELLGIAGGAVWTRTSAVDGVTFRNGGGVNIDSLTLKLYGLKK